MELTVADLVTRFDRGEIRLPLMQRDYIWKAKKVVRLLDSLYRGWPIGSFYVWQTHDTYPTKGRIGRVPQLPLDGFYGFLLDGQQRLTSLSLAIKGEADAELASYRAFFDLENEGFYLAEMKKTVKKRIFRGDPLLVPLSELVALDQEDDDEVITSVEQVIESLREQEKLGKNNQAQLRQFNVVSGKRDC